MKCTVCLGHCSDHHACVVQFKDLREYCPYRFEWVCSAKCLRRIVDPNPVDDAHFAHMMEDEDEDGDDDFPN